MDGDGTDNNSMKSKLGSADPETSKLVFTQDGVSVKVTGQHRRDTSWHFGRINITEEPHGPVLEWKPNEDNFKLLNSDGDGQGWEDVNSVAIGYRVVSPDVVRVKPQKKTIHPIMFDVKEIKSYRMRKGRRKKDVIKLSFFLKDGTTPPTLYFSAGDPLCLINALMQYVQFARSSLDKHLYLALDSDSAALKKSFSELQLFENQTQDLVSKFLHDPYTATMGGFSKVTNYLMDTLLGNVAPTPQAREQMVELFSDHDEEPEFEIITCIDLPPRVPVKRGEPLTPLEWSSYFDQQGRVTKKDELLEKIFKGGVKHSLRKQVWKYLLGYYRYEATTQEREEERKRKEDEYFVMKLQWKSMTADQETRFSALRERKSLIEKDVNRTDRTHQYFEGEDNQNVTVLFEILMTYCMYNFDLGYVQGMSDLLSPILFVMDNEVDAFWCFVGFMNMVSNNFEMDQHGMKMQLHQLHSLLRVSDPKLFDYLESHESGNLYFCFRWLLILFKREFNFDDVMRMWEVLWTGKPCKNYHLVICLAILGQEKDTLMENEYGLTEILKHINDMAYHLDLESILKDAESIYIQLSQCKELPPNILDILGLKIPDLPSRASGENASLEKGNGRDVSPSALKTSTSTNSSINLGSISNGCTAGVNIPSAASMIRGELTCHSPDSNGSADTSSIEVIPEDLETHFYTSYDTFT